MKAKNNYSFSSRDEDAVPVEEELLKDDPFASVLKEPGVVELVDDVDEEDEDVDDDDGIVDGVEGDDDEEDVEKLGYRVIETGEEIDDAM